MNFLKLFKHRGLIAAHRGARSISPENTLTALKKSLCNCDFIEVDVQLSSDFIPIIMHDDTLIRTTNVSEIDRFKSREPYMVHDFSFDELRTLDYGSWFDNKYEPLLSLIDTLDFVSKNGVYINLEIKDMSEYFSDETVISIVLKEIVDKKLQKQVLISSFRHEYLPMIKEVCKSIATAALVEDEHPDDVVEYLKSLKVDAYNFSNKLVDKKIVIKLIESGFYVNVYTVNEQSRAEELFNMGINGVFSDSLKKVV